MMDSSDLGPGNQLNHLNYRAELIKNEACRQSHIPLKFTNKYPTSSHLTGPISSFELEAGFSSGEPSDRQFHSIIDSCRQLISNSSRQGSSRDSVKAAQLFGERGFDIGASARRQSVLSDLSIAAGRVPAQLPVDKSLRGDDSIQFRARDLERIGNTVALHSLARARAVVSIELADIGRGHCHTSWQNDRQRVYDLLDSGLSSPESQQISQRQGLTPYKLAYAQQVQAYNERVISGKSTNLSQLFQPVALHFNDKHAEELWTTVSQCLYKVVDVSFIPSQAELLSLRCSSRFQTRYIQLVIDHLERNFSKHMQATLDSCPRAVDLGGDPSFFSKLKSFVALKLPLCQHGVVAPPPLPPAAQSSVLGADMSMLTAGAGAGNMSLAASLAEDALVDERSIWAYVYYAFRAGHYLEAAAIAEQHLPNAGDPSEPVALIPDAIRTFERSGRTLPADLRSTIQIQYKRSVRRSPDLFKRALFCALGACSPLDRHAALSTTIEDYLWFRLIQLSRDDENSLRPVAELIAPDAKQSASNLQPHSAQPSARFTLEKLQQVLADEFHADCTDSGGYLPERSTLVSGAHGTSGDVNGALDASVAGGSGGAGGPQPWVYLLVLLFTGQFELAVAWLAREKDLHFHGVHLALVLSEIGLLLTLDDPSRFADAPLVTLVPGDSNLRCLNLVRLLSAYTKHFRTSDPHFAIDYFYFLRKIKSRKVANAFIERVCDLALETREYERVLGIRLVALSATSDPGASDSANQSLLGTSTSSFFNLSFAGTSGLPLVGLNARAEPPMPPLSAVMTHLNADYVTQELLGQLATLAEERCLLEDAVQLFYAAKKATDVFRLLSELIADFISTPPPTATGSTPNVETLRRDAVLRLAVTIARRYRISGQAIDMESRSAGTFFLLLDLATFFHNFYKGQFEKAFLIISKLEIFPSSTNEITNKLNLYKSYSFEIRRQIPSLLLTTMTVFRERAKFIRSSLPYGSLSDSNFLSSIGDSSSSANVFQELTRMRERATALLAYKALLPVRFSVDASRALQDVEREILAG